MAPQILQFAFCLCDEVTLSDFITPSEILAGINLADVPFIGSPEFKDVPYRVKFDFLAPTKEPVKSIAAPNGPTLNPTKSYEEALKEGLQYDVLWVPAGPLPDPTTGADRTPQAEIDFIKAQAPKAKYVMSVCGGSAILAAAGVLSGKKATTNKMMLQTIENMTPKDIQWVRKARWVVDGNVWTSSGVTAGSDMALAFVAHLGGDKLERFLRGQVEIAEREQDDDPFAEFHGLV